MDVWMAFVCWLTLVGGMLDFSKIRQMKKEIQDHRYHAGSIVSTLRMRVRGLFLYECFGHAICTVLMLGYFIIKGLAKSP